MFIKEYRRVKRAPVWSSHFVVWDRTFYVCESKRVDGKPRRIVHGYFKNAMSIDEAIENTEREIKRIEGNAGQARAIGCDSYNSHCLQRERVFLETLHQWKAQFPDWKAEPIGDVPLHLWPTLKQKTKPQKHPGCHQSRAIRGMLFSLSTKLLFLSWL